MGLLFRAALVIGAIYALSPVDAPPLPMSGEAARTALADPAKAAASKAIEACLARPDICARLAGLASDLASEPSSTKAAPHPPLPPPRDPPARPERRSP